MRRHMRVRFFTRILQLAHVRVGTAPSIFNRTAPTAATHHQHQHHGWLTRSRSWFPAVAPLSLADAYNYTVASDFDDMNMTSGPGNPGRSYKYLDDESLALWPFGFGLSYTTFSLTKGSDTETDAAAALTIARPADEAVTSIVVKNTGDVVGDEVFLAWACFRPRPARYPATMPPRTRRVPVRCM